MNPGRVVAWYVHHHGHGHLHRALAVVAHLRAPVIGLSSLPRPDGWPGRWVQLDGDADGVDPATGDVTAGGRLHWAPLDHPGLRARTAAISAVLADTGVAVMVSDVSVEVGVLARLHGVALVVMAQPGRRTDAAHRLGYDLATRVVAPWPVRPEPDRPAAWRDRTVHTGAFSRFDGRDRTGDRRPGRVAVMWGSGGLDLAPADLVGAAAATPGWDWCVVGDLDVGVAAPSNLSATGWCDDPWPQLCAAEVVVCHAGQNAVAEVAAARTPAVVVPQSRPFDEQCATADALRRAGLAVVVDRWPPAARWPGLLTSAGRLDGSGWERWAPGDGAARAAAAIDAAIDAAVSGSLPPPPSAPAGATRPGR